MTYTGSILFFYNNYYPFQFYIFYLYMNENVENVEKFEDFEFDFAMCHGSLNEDKDSYYCCIL